MEFNILEFIAGIMLSVILTLMIGTPLLINKTKALITLALTTVCFIGLTAYLLATTVGVNL